MVTLFFDPVVFLSSFVYWQFTVIVLNQMQIFELWRNVKSVTKTHFIAF